MKPRLQLNPTGRTLNPGLWTSTLLAFIPFLLVSCASPANPGAVQGAPTETYFPAAATQQPGVNPNAPITTVPTASFGDPLEKDLERIFPTLPEGLERVEGTEEVPITGEVPASLLESILEDLSNRQSIDPQHIEVVRAEAVIWPDGSLGCPKLGEFYTQEPVNGYWIILEVEAIPYDYRASERGDFKLCEGPFPLSQPNQPDE